MALTHDKQMQMRVSDEFLRAIDDWRRDQDDIPSRAEAIRRLIHIGITAEPILRDLLRMLEALDDGSPDITKHIRDVRGALG